MRTIRSLAAFLLLIVAGTSAAAAAQVQKYMMTKPLPPSCDAALVNPPLAYAAFSTGEPEAYLWFYVTDLKAGDIIASEYYKPTGGLPVAPSGPFDQLTSPGNYCFTDSALKIAGALPASNSGVWTVKVTLNGTPLFSLNFTIGTMTIPVASSGTGGGGTTPVPTANLIRNGDAETGPISSDCSGLANITDWVADGKASICSYGVGDYLQRNSPGPVDRGSNFFAGGNNDRSMIYQIINVDSYATQIDAGTLPYTLSGWLGGWDGQDDNAKLSAVFKSASGQPLGYASVGPVLAADRKGATSLIFKSTSGMLPTGTRSIVVDVTFTKAGGVSNDGYADNLSLTLTGGTTGGGGTTPTCNYSVPASSSLPGSGGTGTVMVTTATGCTWTAASNTAWIVITSGASGSGSGSVSYRADANSTSSPRTGTLTIAGVTHTVTQAAGIAPCSYSLSPTSATVTASGGTASVSVSTTAGCAWTASSNASWITVSSGASGSGAGAATFSVAANNSVSSRTGTVTVAGLTFTVTQAGQPASGGGPVINKGGVVNAASYISAALPSGAIARGSFFSIFGTDLGPAQYAQATTYPIQTTLADVSVRVSQGATGVNALPVFVAATQINAVMPSNAPLGDVQVTVTYRGRTSAPATIRIVNANFGAFSTAGGRGPGILQNYNSEADQPLNTRNATAKPGQVMTLWGTGLGPISAPDNMAPPAGDLPGLVEVYVGGKLVKKYYAGRAPCCAGVDQIVFEVPPDAPVGCYIPVQVRTGSSYSNVVTMAIEANGQACQDSNNPFASLPEKGGKAGFVILARANASLALEAGKPPTDMLLDLGAGAFQEYSAGGELGYNPLLSFPALGTCTSFSGDLDLSKVLGGGTKVEDSKGLTGRALDAGAQLTVSGPKGTLPLPKTDTAATTGPYGGLLGGTLPIGSGPSLPPFLDGGQYTIRGPGGKDVGPFSVSLNVPAGVTWTNRSQIRQIDRNAGVTLNWSGGGSGSQLIVIGGASSDEKNQVAAGFVCFVPAAQGSFTVPPNVLGNLPASVGENAEQTVGALMMGTIPAPPYTTFTASGLDSGLAFYVLLNANTVPYK